MRANQGQEQGLSFDAGATRAKQPKRVLCLVRGYNLPSQNDKRRLTWA